MFRRIAVVAVFLLLLAPGLAQAAPELPYYLALGDSLARGFQPLPNGIRIATNQGYVDDLYRVLRLKHPLLQLHKLGCPNETSFTMVNGGVCPYPAGNQLEQAVEFIQTHHVVLITITIGGDDILHCVTTSGGVPDPTCVPLGLAQVQENLQQILGTLRQNAGWSVPIIGGNYYDPILAASVLLPPPDGQDLADASLVAITSLNAIEEGLYAAFGAKVADVAKAYRITDSSLVPIINIPLNVLLELKWTWIGAPPPRGPDIHPNATGYAVIAAAFLKAKGTF